MKDEKITIVKSLCENGYLQKLLYSQQLLVTAIRGHKIVFERQPKPFFLCVLFEQCFEFVQLILHNLNYLV